jgi:hypothetical protein
MVVLRGHTPGNWKFSLARLKSWPEAKRRFGNRLHAVNLKFVALVDVPNRSPSWNGVPPKVMKKQPRILPVGQDDICCGIGVWCGRELSGQILRRAPLAQDVSPNGGA